MGIKLNLVLLILVFSATIFSCTHFNSLFNITGDKFCKQEIIGQSLEETLSKIGKVPEVMIVLMNAESKESKTLKKRSEKFDPSSLDITSGEIGVMFFDSKGYNYACGLKFNDKKITFVSGGDLTTKGK